MGHPPIAPHSREPHGRLATYMAALTDAIVNAPRQLASERRAAVAGDPLPEPLGVFADKVRHQAYAITDDDIDALRQHGLDEDAIFELTVASAVGAASARLQAGLRGADLHGANLRGARLAGAKVDAAADLHDASAHIQPEAIGTDHLSGDPAQR